MLPNLNEIMKEFYTILKSGEFKKLETIIQKIEQNENNYDFKATRVIKTFIRAYKAFYQSDFRQSLEYSQTALSLLETCEISLKSQLNVLLVKIRNVLAASLSYMGRREEGHKYYIQNLKELKSTENYEDLIVCLNNIGYIFLEMGEYDTAFEYLNEGSDFVKKAVASGKFLETNDLYRFKVLNCTIKENMALVLIKKADYVTAKHLLEVLMQETMRMEYKPGEVKIVHDLGIIYLEQGDHEKANQMLSEALILAERIGDHRRTAMIIGDLGELHLRTGNLSHAKRMINNSIRIFKDICNEEEIVKRLCQISEIEDLLGASEIEVMKHLNEASKISQQHSSKEEMLLTRYYLSTRYFRRGFLDLALLTFEEIFNECKKLNFHQLAINCELYLSAIEISYYLDDLNPNRLEKAQSYLSSIIEISNKQNLIFFHLNGLILSAILKICKEDANYALSDLEKAKNLANRTENIVALEKINKLVENFHFIQEMTQINRKDNLKESYLTKHSALFFLQEFAYLKHYGAFHQHIGTYGYLFVGMGSLGPQIFHQSENILNYATIGELFRSSLAIINILGQGNEYHQGLYGPFPINKNSNCFAFTSLITDSKLEDARFKGKNYCMYVIVIPSNVELSLNLQHSLHKFLTQEITQIIEINNLNRDWFEKIRKNIVQNFF